MITEDESQRDVPAWIAPILQRQSAEAAERELRRQEDGEHMAGAINRRLAGLDIEPLSPAEWGPGGLHKAVLLEPGQLGTDWGVLVGWHEGAVTLFAYDWEGSEHYVGPLNSTEDAADAWHGPRATRPEPVDHVENAEDDLNSASRAVPHLNDPDVAAFVYATCAQARALLALNETLSRIGARHAIAQAARISSLPLTATLSPGERRLIDDLNVVVASES